MCWLMAVDLERWAAETSSRMSPSCVVDGEGERDWQNGDP